MLKKLVPNGLVRENPAIGSAILSGVEIYTHVSPIRRLLEVSVFEDDYR